MSQFLFGLSKLSPRNDVLVCKLLLHSLYCIRYVLVRFCFKRLCREQIWVCL